jgi:hypothetical protein
MDPSNFVVYAAAVIRVIYAYAGTQNASWSINSLKVYKKQLINGRVSSAIMQRVPMHWVLSPIASLILGLAFMS